MKLTIIIFILTTTIALTKTKSLLCDVKWPRCSITFSVQNIVCERDEKCLPEKGCQDFPMDTEFLKYILHEHNRLRQKVASGQENRGYTGVAANMHALSYDKDLEYTAKCNVNRCKAEHDKCHRTGKFFDVGQNIYFSAASEDDLKNAVSVWFSEIDKMTSDVVDRYPKGRNDINQFTQVIWADTTHIGCAKAKSTTDHKYYLVCNYGPAGNQPGHSIYQRGTPCSKCGFFGKCNNLYPALCGNIDQSYLGDGRGGSGDSYTITIGTTPKSKNGLFSGFGDATGLGSRGGMKLGFGNIGRGNNENLDINLGNGGSTKFGLGINDERHSTGSSAGLNVGLGNGGSMNFGIGGSGGKNNGGLSTGINAGLGNGGNMKLSLGNNGGGKNAGISTGLGLGLGNGGGMKLGFENNGGKENARISTGLNLGLGNSGSMKLGLGNTGTGKSAGISTGISLGGKENGEIGASVGAGGLNVNVGLGRGHNKHKNGKGGSSEEADASFGLGGLGNLGFGRNNNRGRGRGHNNGKSRENSDEDGVDESIITVNKVGELGAIAPKAFNSLNSSKVAELVVPITSTVATVSSTTKFSNKKTSKPVTDLVAPIRNTGTLDTDLVDIISDTETTFKTTQGPTTLKSNVLETTTETVGIFIPELNPEFGIKPITISPILINKENSKPLISQTKTSPTTVKPKTIPPTLKNIKTLEPITSGPKTPSKPEKLFTTFPPTLITIKHSEPIISDPKASLTPVKPTTTSGPVIRPLKSFKFPNILEEPKNKVLLKEMPLQTKPPIVPEIVTLPELELITNQSVHELTAGPLFEPITQKYNLHTTFTPARKPNKILDRIFKPEHEIPFEKITLPSNLPINPKIDSSSDLEHIILEHIDNPIQAIEKITLGTKNNTMTKQILTHIFPEGINSTTSFPNMIITYNETEEEADSESPFALGSIKWYEVKWYALGGVGVIAIVILSFVLGRVCRPKGSYWIKKELPQPIHGKISHMNQPSLYSNENHIDQPSSNNNETHINQPPSNSNENHIKQSSSYSNEIHMKQPSSYSNESHVKQPSHSNETHMKQPSSNYNESHINQPSPYNNEVHIRQPSSYYKESHMNQPSSYSDEAHIKQPSPYYNESHMNQPSSYRDEAHIKQPSPYYNESHMNQPSSYSNEDHIKQPSPYYNENYKDQQSSDRTEGDENPQAVFL